MDTDRLPEEKRRGITIVLGFAPMDLPSGRRIGVVDVPGHERFVKNMVAGAGGIDLALLVVAADEGVMPQTREHIEICELLGVRRAVVALTKTDRAGTELSQMAQDDVAEYLAPTSFADAPIIPCSAQTREGLDAVLQAIDGAVAGLTPRAESSTFALPVDRVFTVKGFGSVVTGTALCGAIAPGESVEIQPPPPGRPATTARVRSVEVFHEHVQRGYAGDRTALSLQGISLDQLRRGQLITTPGAVKPTRCIEAKIRHLGSRNKPLKSQSKALLHIGTSIVEASVTLLDVETAPPGDSAFARIRTSEEIAALFGQRFILRGFEAATTAGRTLGGGVVLDPESPARKRLASQTTEVLTAIESAVDGSANAAIAALIDERKERGQDITALARRLGRDATTVRRSVGKLKNVTMIGEIAVSTDALRALGNQIAERIDAFHKEHPFKVGMALGELQTRFGSKIPASVIQRAANMLVGSKTLALQSEGYHRPSHRPFGGAGEGTKLKVVEALETAVLEPPSLSALGELTGLDAKPLRELLSTLVSNGDVVRASPTLYFDARAFEGARTRILEFIESEGQISTAQAKALLGISRKYLIPFLEALDKMRVTVRVGEVRKAR